MIVSCEENILPTTLSRYQLNEIYNVYEFSLFYKALPSKSLYFQAYGGSGGKHSKVRITGMAVFNALGENIPTFAVKKSTKLKAWSTFETFVNIVHEREIGTLFGELLHELDCKFERQGRKISLDRC